MRERDIEQNAESLFRICEFHAFVGTNVLFPWVPDSERDAMLAELLKVEHRLVNWLYDHGEIDRVAAIKKGLLSAVRPRGPAQPVA